MTDDQRRGLEQTLRFSSLSGMHSDDIEALRVCLAERDELLKAGRTFIDLRAGRGTQPYLDALAAIMAAVKKAEGKEPTDA